MKIELEFDSLNSFVRLPEAIDREPLVTILGNILDNAFEAVAAENSGPRTVRLYLTDLGPDLIIEVEDSGPGVAKDMVDTLFQTGVTSKNGRGRGTGLSLVARAVKRLEGQITFGDGELGGALFTVIIPNRYHN
jgi:two-component system CitB family sensor kinase/two-component system sensor histidine kinase DcuS